MTERLETIFMTKTNNFWMNKELFKTMQCIYRLGLEEKG
jgi:hypothetical protein